MKNSNSTPQRLALVLLVIVITLRIIGSSGELWLDEVWNLDAVKPLGSPLQVFFGEKRLDGHSSLMSCILFFFPQNLADFAYRTPSLLFSCGLLLLLYLNVRDYPKRLFILTLCSLSYLLTLYGTEVRGYSGMLFFLVLGFFSWDRLNKEGKVKDGALFVLSACCALMFHYSFIMWYGGVLLTETIESILRRKLPSRIILASHATILTFVALVYVSILRFLPQGTGPRPSYLDTFIGALSVTAGGPVASSESPDYIPFTLAAALFASAIGFVEIRRLFSLCRKSALLYLNTIVISPLSVTLILQPDVVLPRYFLSVSVMWLFLFASFLTHSSKKNPLWIAPITIFLAGNLWLQSTLVLWGRGSYHKVVAEIPKLSSRQPIIADHDFRHGLVLDYYFKDRFEVIDVDSLQENPRETTWYLAHSLDWSPKPRPKITLENGQVFELKKVVPATHLSGWHTFLYKSEGK